MRILYVFIFLLISLFAHSQTNLSGLWQGVMMKDGAKELDYSIVYLQLDVQGNGVVGKTREEFYKTDFYAIQRVKGAVESNQLKFQQLAVEKKKINAKITLCSMDFQLTYIDSTGYLTGKYISNTCRGNTGKLIFYRSTSRFQETDSVTIGHYWRDRFLTDLKKGRKAPEIQELERKNFKFQPIYFDYDQAEIKPEFQAYLSKMAQVVNGHSDLRIRITGHTDADGSDAYNDDLSAKRAKAIQDYFLKCGLESFKVVIDFKGEKLPVGSNQTPEGKQKNRRVDFEFI